MKTEFDEIKEYLKSESLAINERAIAINALSEVTDDERVIDFLIDIFKKEKNTQLLTSAAISLGKLGVDSIVPYIIDLLKKSIDINNYSGLIYAIRIKPLDCKKYFLDLIGFLIIGNWEIREHIYAITKVYYDDLDVITINDALRILFEAKELFSKIEDVEQKTSRTAYIDKCIDILSSSTGPLLGKPEA